MRLLIIGLLSCAASSAWACTITTASGHHAPAPGSFCAGQLIFEDNFNSLDQSRWRHEQTLGGGGNGEFQWYVNDRANSYASGGNVHLRPTFTSDVYGEGFLSTGTVTIPPSECTQSGWDGCHRVGTWDHIINPIRSARLDSWDSFRFKFGTLEIRAKLPAGDWLWPALWLMPRFSEYGGWPASGEIDLMEGRGNRDLLAGGVHIGTQQAGSTLHFGPAWNVNGWDTSHGTRNQNPGYDSNFHTYKLVWNTEGLRFYYENDQVLFIPVGNGFWARGGFDWSGLPNPWTGGTAMAPFDREFFIIMNLAVGGTNGYFPDGANNGPGPKPWANGSNTPMRDFWWGREHWDRTWYRNEHDGSHFQIDYVRVWAI